MPYSRNIVNLLRCICIVSILESFVGDNHLRALWEWSAPHVVSIYDYIGYDDDLRLLARMTITTFNNIFGRMDYYYSWPRNWWETTGDHGMLQWTGKKSVNVLSPKDRFLRYLMLNTNHSVSSLVATFGQNKSVIYQDYKFIAIGIVKMLGAEWLSLPRSDTDAYRSLLGQGVLSDSNGDTIWHNVPYICDVTTIRIQRPTYAQREHYNGHKKYHTVDFHCTHSVAGRLYSVVGPFPGSYNDIQAAKNSLLYQYRNTYLAPGHAALADLAYYNIGDPFLCRISFQESCTHDEETYNICHSRARVISENWYGRFKTCWTY